MADTFNTYAGDGATNAWTVGPDYLKKSHVHLYIDGVEDTLYTWITSTSIAAASTPADGAVVLVKRETPRDALSFVIPNSGTVRGTDHNNQALQALYVAEEAYDALLSTMSTDAADVYWAAQSKQIKAVADPTSAQDAATKAYTDAAYATIEAAITASAAASASSASAASTSSGLASTYATNSSNSATAASNSASAAAATALAVDAVAATVVADKVATAASAAAALVSEDAAAASADAAAALFAAGRDAAIFYPVDYLSTADMAYARNYDFASQNATAVTAALVAMHDAMMTWAQGGADRVAIARYGAAGYAVNGELLSATFYAAIYAQTSLGTAKGFGFIGEGPRLTKFEVMTGASPVTTRASGPFSGVASPAALWPLHYPFTNRGNGYFYGIEAFGSQLMTDPIGIYTMNCLDHNFENLNFEKLNNTGLFVDGCFNSRSYDVSQQACGLQPVAGGSINGADSGFPDYAVTFVLSDDGSDVFRVTASATYFDAAQIGEELWVENGRTVNAVAQPVRGVIASVVSPTVATIDVEAGTVCNAGTRNVSFGILHGSVTAGSDQLILEWPLSIGTAVGRHIFLPKAGNEDRDDQDLLSTLIEAVSGDGLTVTLKHNARFTVARLPVVIAPCNYVGITANNVTSGAEPNDFTINMTRSEHQSGYSNAGSTSSIVLILQSLELCNIYQSKSHGCGYSRSNSGAGAFNMLIDASKVDLAGHQFSWGSLNTKGNTWIMGDGSQVGLDNAHWSHFRMHGDEAMLYIDPMLSTVANTSVSVSGRIHNSDVTSFPNSNQAFAKYGTNGDPRMLSSKGTIASMYRPFSAEVPPSRTRVEAEAVDSAGDTVLYPVVAERGTTGTPAIGIGVGVKLKAETAAGNWEDIALFEAITTSVTGAAETAYIDLKAMISGAAPTSVAQLAALVATFPGDIVLNTVTGKISVGTTDGSDTGYMLLCGGGAPGTNPRIRGAYIYAYGNENANSGSLVLAAGNKAGADMLFYTKDTKLSGRFNYADQSFEHALKVVATTDLADIGNVINTEITFKRKGVCVYDETSNQLMVAQGATAASTWKSADGGTVTVTPV